MNTTEREELELVAKAAGMELRWRGDGVGDKYTLSPCTYHGLEWDPKGDDGDAIRLLVATGLDLQTSGCGSVYVGWCSKDEWLSCEESGVADRMLAVRRAIWRAAVELGRQMP